jgi:hypothetical protein
MATLGRCMMARPRKYATPEEARAAKTAKQKARRVFASQLETTIGRDIAECCIQWHDSSPHRRWRCKQHQDHDKFTGQSANPNRLSDAAIVGNLASDGANVRVSADPDSWLPQSREDKAQDKAESALADEWRAS